MLALIMLAFTGCWNRKEPKDLAIVNSVIYDINDNGQYKIIAELLNVTAGGGSKESTPGDKSPNLTATNEGNSPREALGNISESIDRIVFGGHNKVRFFTEKFAKTDMGSILDYFLRDHLTDETPYMVVIKDDDPKKIYSSMIGLADTVGNYIENLSNHQPTSISKSVFPTTLEFARDYYNEGKQPVTGLVQLVECESKSPGNAKENSDSKNDDSEKEYRVVYEGLAAFKDNKLVGYMDGIETRSYNFLTNNIKSANITVPAGDSFTVVEIIGSKSDVKTTFEDGRIILDIKLNANLGVIAEGDEINVTKAKPLKTIQNQFNEQIKKEIIAAVNKAQSEFKSDIFGFGDYMHIQHADQWKEIKNSWDDYFADAEVNVTVDSSITRSGETKMPVKMEEKEE